MKLMCSSSIKMIFSQTSVWCLTANPSFTSLQTPSTSPAWELWVSWIYKKEKKRDSNTQWIKSQVNIIFLCCGIIRGIFGMSFFTINLKILYVSTKHSQPHSSHKQSPELSLSYFNAGRSHIGAMWHKGFP